MSRRLYRSDTERMIWGVCGGLAKYFDLDPVIIRIAFVLLAFANGLGILGYILLAIFVPRESKPEQKPVETVEEAVTSVGEAARGLGNEITEQVKSNGDRHTSGMVIIGVVLLVLGVLFLLSNLNFFWWFRWARFWPILLIIFGLLLIWRRRR